MKKELKRLLALMFLAVPMCALTSILFGAAMRTMLDPVPATVLAVVYGVLMLLTMDMLILEK